MKKVSVVCPVYNEERFIEKCIDSLMRQTYPRELCEYIFIDGGSSDSTVSKIENYISLNKDIKILHNPRRIIPVSMNKGISEASGEYVVRIDAHAEYPDNYISRLIEVAQATGAENTGGLCETLPACEGNKAEGISIALSSSFGMGNSHFRVGCDRMMEVDTVPFGCFRREFLLEAGGFDERFVRNQDDELNGRIRKKGGKILLLPDLKVKYYPRSDYRSLWRMWYGYALYKPMVARALGAPATMRQFVPLICMLLSLTMCVAGMWALMGFCVALWLGGALLSACRRSAKTGVVMSALIAYFIVHGAYAVGYAAGIARESLKSIRR